MPKTNGDSKQCWHIRIGESDIERVRMQAKRLGRKVGEQLSVAAVIRRCISLGLAQLERGK